MAGHDERGEPYERGARDATETEAPTMVTDGQRYRLRVYLFVQARMRDEAVKGAIPTTAMWLAVRDACQVFDLDTTDWSRLIRCLLLTTAKQ